DPAVFQHPLQHVALALLGAIRMADGREPLRGLDQARKQRRLAEIEVARFLAEVEEGSLLHAVAPVTEVDLVQVQVEDLVLAEVALQSTGEDRLLDLPAVGALGGEQEGLDHLLRDGGRALAGLARGEVLEEGPDDPDVIEPLVFVELRVLCGEDGALENLRDLPRRDDGPPLLEELADQRAVGGEDLRRTLGVVVDEGVKSWQVGSEDLIDRGQCGAREKAQCEQGDKERPTRAPPGTPSCPLPRVSRGATSCHGAPIVVDRTAAITDRLLGETRFFREVADHNRKVDKVLTSVLEQPSTLEEDLDERSQSHPSPRRRRGARRHRDRLRAQVSQLPERRRLQRRRSYRRLRQRSLSGVRKRFPLPGGLQVRARFGRR